MILEITRKHITEGDPAGYDNTPLALALTERFGHRVVWTDAAKFYMEGAGITHLASNRALQAFVFNMGARPEVLVPISFELPELDLLAQGLGVQ